MLSSRHYCRKYLKGGNKHIEIKKIHTVEAKYHTTRDILYGGYKNRQGWMIFAIIGLCSFTIFVGIIHFFIQNKLNFIPLFIFYFTIIFSCYIAKRLEIKHHRELFHNNTNKTFRNSVFFVRNWTICQKQKISKSMVLKSII